MSPNLLPSVDVGAPTLAAPPSVLAGPGVDLSLLTVLVRQRSQLHQAELRPMRLRAEDTEYEDHVLDAVTPCDGGWEIKHDGCCFFCPDHGVIPHVGDVARFYGRGFGSPVRGLAINGVVVFYRTQAEQAAKHAEDTARYHQEQRDRFERDRESLDAKYGALPQEFQARLDRFRRNHPEFRWRHEAYEMSVCVDAVKIARALGSVEAIRHFQSLSWAEQVALVPGLFDGHSGNSFGAAVSLAAMFLNRPDLVDQAHGALCPLVGCKDYGCYAAELQEETAP